MKRRVALTLVELLVVLTVIGLLVALMLPAVRSARGPARRNQCMNNLRQQAIAVLNYQDINDNFPAAFTADERNEMLHGWRTQLLPFIEEETLYDAIDLDQPWDAPANELARARPLDAFECPSSPREADEEGRTNYLAVVGAGFAFPGVKRATIDDFLDGTAKSLLFTEEAAERFVPWLAPEESDESRFLNEADTFSRHPGVHLVAFADGHCAALNVEAGPEIRRALLTIAGGEDISDDDL